MKLHQTFFFQRWVWIILLVAGWRMLSTTSFQPSTVKTRVQRDAVTSLFGKSRGAKQQETIQEPWFPRSVIQGHDDDIYAGDSIAAEIEQESVKLMAQLIRKRISYVNHQKGYHESKENYNPNTIHIAQHEEDQQSNAAYELVKGRFMDLTCHKEGEEILEQMFYKDREATEASKEVLQGAIMVMQSLITLGTQVGVKGAPLQLRRKTAHLQSQIGNSKDHAIRDFNIWDIHSVRRLKHRIDRAPALQVLAELGWKRSTQGAFDLLVLLEVWTKHEDLPLLRSGFPLRFSAVEEQDAQTASHSTRDIDELLGLRRDLRHFKIFTIDGKETSEIDDGISIEVITDKDGKNERHRIWIHIADADRWAPRDSHVFQAARNRITSLYLPRWKIPMFPTLLSNDIMSLKANTDCCALSLGVELLEDGSIDPASIIVTPSIVNVMYRLTYDEVDEMLEEGIGYREEWELGSLLGMAIKRREFRIRAGSSEGVAKNPVPQGNVTTFPDKDAPDGIGVAVTIQATHNAGKNETTGAEDDERVHPDSFHVAPVSSAFVLVTEMMILSGEALGKWKLTLDAQIKDSSDEESRTKNNQLRLAFRTQAAPDYNARQREKEMLMNLLEYNIGGGFCHAWFMRRFLNGAMVSDEWRPHSGLGLQSYVQWTSPIRRFSDLQVHASVKRYLRRNKVLQLIQNGKAIPSDLQPIDLGCPVPRLCQRADGGDAISAFEYEPWDFGDMLLDEDIDFLEGGGLVGAARTLQRQSQQYWIFEYVRRSKEADPDRTFDAMVLGCVDYDKLQYAIYLYDLGYEHRYTSPTKLASGFLLKLKVSSVQPRAGLMSFVRVNA